jgi:cobalt-zinc-cadmium efflux system protein
MEDKKHKHTHDREGKNLLAAALLNLIIALVEVVGGLLSNSLALLSDAVHNLSDGLAVLLAWIAKRISRRQRNNSKTFGYKRIEILAALLNSSILIAICVFLIFEAIKRFLNPQEVDGVPMFVVAIIGLLANLASVLLLHRFRKSSLNTRAAYLHLIGDTLSSVAVIIGGVLIIFFGITWIDPLITLLISIYIIKETWEVLLETVNILMQSSPNHINIADIKQELEASPEICNVHHMHLWSLNENEIHFEAHVNIDRDMQVSGLEPLRVEIQQILNKKFGIMHVTLQFEYGFCSDELVHSPH